MIPSFIIDKFKYGMYVIHPSLLPKYRGSSPIQYTLLNDDKEAGVSIIEISKDAFDKGPIVHQEKINVSPIARYQDLALELSILGAMRTIDMLENFDYFKKNTKPQSEFPHTPSLAPKFHVNDTEINWKESTAQQVFNKFRAFYGTHFKTIRTKFNDSWLLIDEMDVVPSEKEEDRLLTVYKNAVPGSIWLIQHKTYKNNIYVKCKDGWIRIQGLYLEGKLPQASHKFINQFIDRNKIQEDKEGIGHYILKSDHKHA